jgi:hypothetical protein
MHHLGRLMSPQTLEDWAAALSALRSGTWSMTEDQWLACTEPHLMLESLRGKVSDRKLRLLAVACCRAFWHLITDDQNRHAVEVAEAYADGDATESELNTARELAFWGASELLEKAVRDAVMWCSSDSHTTPDSSFQHFAGWVLTCVSGAAERPILLAKEYVVALLRDIFGNPYRPPDAVSLTLISAHGDVARIAQRIYDERSFGNLATLRDALLNAGCTDSAMLSHCRQPSEHVRGCWVVDLVLAKP